LGRKPVLCSEKFLGGIYIMIYQQKPWLKFYDPRVDENVSVKHESLYDFLESAVNRFGDRPAFTFYGKVF
jgi:long-chain acyl-CoA synthetase